MSTISFDKTALKRFYNNSYVDFAEILHDYLKNQKEIRASLKQAFKEGVESLQKSIYTHSSIFCHVGFPKLTTQFLAFEEVCKNTTDVKLLKSQFDALLSKVDESAIIAVYEIEKLEQQIYQ